MLRLPIVAHMLRAYVDGVSTMGPPLTRKWALSREEDKTQWTASTLSILLHEAFTKAWHSPPPCFCRTSHSLRKGAASAAYGIKAPLTDVRYAGDWSTNSTNLESKYVDFTLRPTMTALLLFGYLKKDTPS